MDSLTPNRTTARAQSLCSKYDPSFDPIGTICRPHSDPDISRFSRTSSVTQRRNSAPSSIALPSGQQAPIPSIPCSTKNDDRRDVHRHGPLVDSSMGPADDIKDMTTLWPPSPTHSRNSSGFSPATTTFGAESAISRSASLFQLGSASAEAASKRIETLGFMTCLFRIGRHDINQVRLVPEGHSNVSGHISISDERARFYRHWESDPQNEELDRGEKFVVPTDPGRCHLASIENLIHQSTDDCFLYFSGDTTFVGTEMYTADIPGSLELCNAKYHRMALDHL